MSENLNEDLQQDEAIQQSPAVSEILGSLPIQQLAAELGVDSTEVKQASSLVISQLLGQLASNASEPEGEQSLAQALTDHLDDGIVDDDGTTNLDKVDVTDGDKIIQHTFDAPADQAANFLGAAATPLVRKLLPILAPIVLSYLSNKLGKGQAAQVGGSSILQAILNGMLGGQAQTQQRQSGFTLGDILSGMLGAGVQQQTASAQQAPSQNPWQVEGSQQSNNGGGLLGDILGGIFGGR